MIVHKSAGKTLDDRFVSCENIGLISFKRIYPPPPPGQVFCSLAQYFFTYQIHVYSLP